jgi:hypothetical protein
MRSKILLTLFTLSCIFALGLAHAQEAQDPNDEDDARGTFLKSRENKSSVPTAGNTGGGGTSGVGTIGGATSSVRPRPTPRPTPRATPRPTPPRDVTAKNTKKPTPKATPKTGAGAQNNSGGQTASVKPPTNNTGDPSMVKVKLDPSSIGLGYSLFQRGTGEEPFRVDPSNEFRSGDQVRIWLEPSADGYLYIFNTTNNGKASLIYPDVRLNGGNNKVKAHFPFELPSAEEKDPANRWFSFYGSAGTEQVYILLTREPLKSLPNNPAALASYCSQNKNADGACQVQDSVWSTIKAFDQKDQVYVAKNNAEVGQKQARAEKPGEINSRGFGLAPKEPAPTIIFMNASADRSVLFAKLELKHN